MAHPAAPAAAVVVAEAVIAPDQAVAREYEQVLQPLVALPGRADRRYGDARLAVLRRYAAVRSQVVVVGKVLDPDSYNQLGGGPGTYPRHGQQARVRAVLCKQPRDGVIDAGRLLVRFPDTPRQCHDLRILCFYAILGRPRRG